MSVQRIGRIGVLLLFGVLTVLGCGESETQRQQEGSTTESEEDAVRSVLDKYTTACESRDFDAVSSVFSHDSDIVVINVADPNRIVGWKSVAEVYKGLFSMSGDVEIRHTNIAVKILASGTAACLTCDQNISGTIQGRAFAIEGVRVTWVLEKEEGQWRIVHAHWSVPSMPDAEDS
jgi:uncharacterized protein (TIGR02246 family)